MHAPWQADKCNARKVETTPPHNPTRMAAPDDPGVEAVLIEWGLGKSTTTNIWPPRSDTSRYMYGLTIANKQTALDLAQQIIDAASSMSD